MPLQRQLKSSDTNKLAKQLFQIMHFMLRSVWPDVVRGKSISGNTGMQKVFSIWFSLRTKRNCKEKPTQIGKSRQWTSANNKTVLCLNPSWDCNFEIPIVPYTLTYFFCKAKGTWKGFIRETFGCKM